ncbi:MAG TPA: redoxin domain-containing protein [Methylomirabilota bacterium]|nr:redoxin domain-containing protein [Methylomirabilota bacterium]
MAGFDAAMPQFEALGAQVVGVSADHVKTLEAFVKQNNTKHLLVSDFRRQMLPAWDAMVTDEKSPIFRYAKRAYFVLDRNGTVKYIKVMQNPLDLLKAEEVVAAVKEAGK